MQSVSEILNNAKIDWNYWLLFLMIKLVNFDIIATWGESNSNLRSWQDYAREYQVPRYAVV